MEEPQVSGMLSTLAKGRWLWPLRPSQFEEFWLECGFAHLNPGGSDTSVPKGTGPIKSDK